ncbi:hypothetical protein [Streptomyces mobaraensis]|uniref:Uncharacterized protein n=1 Tax=Streptomyces mobaraensis TaxID=35621 RepID=A0A5N5WE20_STRMB|nr:hypothetical protein [Streptomyces mobaraensis]KAB7850180.1 hypothetical protein FRZ00_06165 [Streptomyces mobaraensis]
MGMHHSTYFAYGLHVTIDAHPWEEAERVEAELARLNDRCPDVHHLAAGDYDNDQFFLVTRCTEVTPGQFEHITATTVPAERQADWNRQLGEAAEALGYSRITEPGWLVVPDLG